MREIVEMVLHTWDAKIREWGTLHSHRPTWDQVESAIRLLNPVANPRLDIILNEERSPENLLAIVGGEGKYRICGTAGDGWWFQYVDLSKEGTLRLVFAGEWSETAECLVCPDTELVVDIARFFVQCNAFYPRVGWEVNGEPVEPTGKDVWRIHSALPQLKRVLINFHGGPLDGIKLDSRSTEDSELWDVAWLLAKLGLVCSGHFRESDRAQLRTLTQFKIEGSYELRGRAESAEERGFHLYFWKPRQY